MNGLPLDRLRANGRQAAKKIEYSHADDALYVYFRKVKAARSYDIAEGVVVDFDAQDQIVGIEILDVSSRLSTEDLVNVTIENLLTVTPAPGGDARLRGQDGKGDRTIGR